MLMRMPIVRSCMNKVALVHPMSLLYTKRLASSDWIHEQILLPYTFASFRSICFSSCFFIL